MAGHAAVDRVEQLSERVVQVDVLLGDLADLADQPADPPLGHLLKRLAGGVESTAEHFGEQHALDEALAQPAAKVGDRREGPEVEPAQIRSTCLVTIADAFDDLGRRDRP